jgi:8-oxo-(d)GTP phosphatase
MGDAVIRAAGVVLVRDEGNGPQVAVVHRPRRSDWSLPKGKLNANEHPVTAAVRECLEETGFVPILGAPLPPQSYKVCGRPKVVDYWRASVAAGAFAKNREVDALRWLGPGEAKKLLTYSRDTSLLIKALATPATTPLVIVRHATAEKRSDWALRTGRHRDDPDRPLSAKGAAEASLLTSVLSAYGITRVVSSTAERCVASVRPYQAKAGVQLELLDLLSEEGFRTHPGETLELAQDLLENQQPTLICTHRPVLPNLLNQILAVSKARRTQNLRLPPGGMVVVHRLFSAEKTGRPAVTGLAVETHPAPIIDCWLNK